jgi:hypothetical protein
MNSRLFWSSAVAAIVVAGPAAAQQAVTVSAITGDLGSVVVVRGGETYSLQLGDVLLEGDEIITRQGGTVTIQGPAGTQTLAGLQSVTVGPGLTLAAPINIAAAAVPVAATGAVFPVLPVLGTVAAGGAAAAAAGGGGSPPPPPPPPPSSP